MDGGKDEDMVSRQRGTVEGGMRSSMVDSEGKRGRREKRKGPVSGPWGRAMCRIEDCWVDEKGAVSRERVKVYVLKARRCASAWIFRQEERRERGCKVSFEQVGFGAEVKTWV